MPRKTLVFLFLIIFLSGCASTGKGKKINTFDYKIGVTTRSDVISVLGLPSVSTHDELKHIRILGYKADADGSRLFIPIPIAATQVSPNTQMIYFTNISPSKRNDLRESDVVLIFDETDLLVTVIKNTVE